MINFYHRFIPHCAAILKPLNSLLAGTKGNAILAWNDTCTTAFTEIKNALASATLLVHPEQNSPTCIMTDASEVAVGTVLQQFIHGQWRPLGYFSRTLKPAETRYSAFDRELLAIYLAIKHFRYFVEGRSFHVLTDHKPLTFALHARPDRYTPRQIRQLDVISQYTSDLRHVKGSHNPVADALSRATINAVSVSDDSPPVIDFKAMAIAQNSDPDLQRLRTDNCRLYRWPCPTPPFGATCQLVCRDPMSRPIFVVPSSTLFTVYHTLASKPHSIS
jgi:hypothetical protein